MFERRLSYAALSILHAVAAGVRYGFDIMDRIELPSGTVYPALSRLERDGYLKSHWEDLRKAHGDRLAAITASPRTASVPWVERSSASARRKRSAA